MPETSPNRLRGCMIEVMQFTTAFVQYAGSGPMRHEETLLVQVLERLDIPVRHYSLKRVRRGQLPLGPGTFIAGDVDAMHGAMRQLQIPIPAPDDYPESLHPYLRRRVWTSTLGEVERKLDSGELAPLFVKPAYRRKSFPGTVCYSDRDLAAFGHVSRRQPVHCSELVTWLSEYRVYVSRGRILAVDHYAGDRGRRLDRAVVESAVTAHRESGTAPSAYALDFGVLVDGSTALIEANDGFALGAYDIAPDLYTELLMVRWSELLDRRWDAA